MSRLSLMLLMVSVFSAAFGQLLFKLGASGKNGLLEFINFQIAIGILLYGASTIIWIYVLSFEKLTNVYAFTALTFVLVYLGGVFVIGEKISFSAVLGIALILGGLYLITSEVNS